MFIVAFVNGWAKAIHANQVKCVYVGQDFDGEYGYCIETDDGKYMIDEDELEILVEKRIVTILKRDLKDLCR